MQGTKILCFYLELILFFNLNFEFFFSEKEKDIY